MRFGVANFLPPNLSVNLIQTSTAIIIPVGSAERIILYIRPSQNFCLKKLIGQKTRYGKTIRRVTASHDARYLFVITFSKMTTVRFDFIKPLTKFIEAKTFRSDEELERNISIAGTYREKHGRLLTRN